MVGCLVVVVVVDVDVVRGVVEVEVVVVRRVVDVVVVRGVVDVDVVLVVVELVVVGIFVDVIIVFVDAVEESSIVRTGFHVADVVGIFLVVDDCKSMTIGLDEEPANAGDKLVNLETLSPDNELGDAFDG